jgi:hypothetical protein
LVNAATSAFKPSIVHAFGLSLGLAKLGFSLSSAGLKTGAAGVII